MQFCRGFTHICVNKFQASKYIGVKYEVCFFLLCYARLQIINPCHLLFTFLQITCTAGNRRLCSCLQKTSWGLDACLRRILKSSDQTQDPRCQQQHWWKELRGIWAACKTSRSLPWKKMKWNVPVETRAFSIVCQRWHVAGINVARHGKLIVEEREGAVCLSAFRALVRQGALSQSSLHALEWCSPNFRLPPLQRLQT